MSTSTAIVANGCVFDDLHLKSRLQEFDTIYAVDGGLVHLDRVGVRPSLIIGDMDSVPSELLNNYSDIPLERYPRDKDETDLELALSKALTQPSSRAVIFAGHGERIDHQLGNLMLLSRYPGRATQETENESLFVVDQVAELKLPINTCLSLIPLNGPVKGLKSSGLKWPVDGLELSKSFIGISNETVEDKFSVSVGEGDLLICINGKVELI